MCPAHRVRRGGVPAGPDHPAAGRSGGRGHRPVLVCGVGDQPVRPRRCCGLQLVAGRRRPRRRRRAGHLRDVPHHQPLPPLRQGCRLRLAPGHLRHGRLHRWQRRPRQTQPGRPGHRRRHPPGRAGHAGGLKGDAGEVTHLAARAAAGYSTGALIQSAQRPQATTVRRSDPPPDLHSAAAAFDAQRRALPPGPSPADTPTVGARLQAAYDQPRPDGRPWTARTLADAAGCGRSSDASFLQHQRPSTAQDAR